MACVYWPAGFHESLSGNQFENYLSFQDIDLDGLPNNREFELGTNPTRSDSDSDGFDDMQDAFPLNALETVDTDSDGIGDNADADDDNDGVLDALIWSSKIVVSSSNPQISPGSIQFGMVGGSTENYDVGLDVVAPPTPVAPVQLDAYLPTANEYVTRLLSDFRPEAESVTFRFKVRADVNDFSLSWDLFDLPSTFTQAQLKQVVPVSDLVIDMKAESGASFGALANQYYSFELNLSSTVSIHLSPGWNMISIPGIPLKTDPATLQTVDNSLILPFYRWNSATFSYEPVTELKFGEGYWALTIKPEGMILQIPVTSASSYSRSLQPGWNMIGGVSQVTDFTSPQDDPDNSIIAGTLYGWNPTGFSYESKTEIAPGQGYWVLTMAECQLTVGGEVSVPTSPQVVPEPEMVISLNLSTGEWYQNLEIGWDQSATAGLEVMDQALPPAGPQGHPYQANLVSGQCRLRRDVRPMSAQMVSWQMRISSPEPVHLSIDRRQIPKGQELVIVDGQVETVLISGMEMQLEDGDRELTVSLRPLPKVTQLLQNYPNPFNPETWIPYQLNQASEVSLSVYSSDGKLVRHIDLGLKPAGNYQRTERAVYWDGRNANGESVASGVYFYRLQAEDYSQTRKMVILK